MEQHRFPARGQLILAPMAGVTDWAFRTICGRLGAAVTVTEMVSSRALVYQDKKSITLLRRTEGEGICGAQIFGNDPEIMAQAARLREARRETREMERRMEEQKLIDSYITKNHPNLEPMRRRSSRFTRDQLDAYASGKSDAEDNVSLFQGIQGRENEKLGFTG